MSILVKLYKWGNAQGVLIPCEILKEIGIDDLQNAKLVLAVKNDSIILKKKSLKWTMNVETGGVKKSITYFGRNYLYII